MISAKKKLLGALGKRGQIAFTTPGTYEWTPPPGLRLLSFVLVGGPSQNGAGLSWFSGVPISGAPITIVVAAGANVGQATRVTVDGHTYEANGQMGGGIHSEGAPFASKGGGNGGSRLIASGTNQLGGGAAGYSGNGGNANNAAPPGGGGGGGGNGNNRGGGGVGLMGEGPSGAVNTGGSGGANSTGRGGQFGGGTGGSTTENGFANGAARFIWGGGRAFPSTRTRDE